MGNADVRDNSVIEVGLHDCYLVLLFEAVPLSRLHLVDVLQEVGHSHSRVQLTRVIRRAFPAAVAVRRASQQAAGLVDGAALFVWKHEGDTTNEKSRGAQG